MNRIFALSGKIGCGKSTLAAKIQKNYNCITFSLDKIMLKLFGEIDGRELFLAKEKLCKEIIYNIADDILNNSRANILFDYGFWDRSERNYLRKRFCKYKQNKRHIT